MIVRTRTAVDLPACFALLRAVHTSARYPVNWPADPEAWLTPPQACGCWVVTADERVAGHVCLTRSEGGLLVERLFVDPEQAGGGLGRRLLAHCMAVAADEGLPLSLEVADNCQAAIALYVRSGWRETGRTPIDWGGSAAVELITFTAPTV